MTSPGSGRQRGIAFGGGGEWFVAWTLSFLRVARAHGVDLGTADVTIGTSAGRGSSVMPAKRVSRRPVDMPPSSSRLFSNSPPSMRRLAFRMYQTGSPV